MNIHAISTGRVKVKQQQMSRPGGWAPPMLQILTSGDWSDWLPIYVWVIEHPEGVIVVDTGETSRAAGPDYFPAWHPYFRYAVRFNVAPDDEIGPQLRARGIDPERDVRQVVLTHLHTDHMGGLYHFPNSDWLLDETEHRAATGWTGRLLGYPSQHLPDWFRPQYLRWDDGPLGPFPKSQALTKDGRVIAVPTPGHAPGHLSVIVRTDEVHYFLAGDTSYTQQNLVDDIPDGVSSRESRVALQRIRAYAETYPTIYLPAHDPEAAQRLKEGRSFMPPTKSS